MLSPIGIINSEQQIKVYSANIKSNKLLICTKKNKFNTEIWEEVFYINPKFFFKNALFNNIVKGFFYRSTLRTINKYVNTNQTKSINIYYQNLQCPLTNYIFFNSSKVFGNELKITFNIIEEGIGNYYEYFKVYPQERKRLKIKKIFYWFFGFKINLPDSQTGAYYDHVDKVFVNIPHLSIFSNKSLPLNFTKRKIKCSDNLILILGQESESFIYGKVKYLDSVKELISIVRAQFPNQKIIYKPHWDNRIDILKDFLDSIGTQIEYLSNNESIETLIFKIKPSRIISFSTSAFLTLRVMFDEDTNSKLEMFYFDKFGIPKEIISVFESLNIKSIKTLNGSEAVI